MENHEEFKMLISSYFDGEITADEVRQVEQHLAECALCRAHLKQLKKISSSLKSWPNETLSLDLEHKIQKKLTQKSKEGPLMTTQSTMKLTVSLAVVVLVGVFYFQYYLQMSLQARIKDANKYLAEKTAQLGTSTVQYEPYYLKSNVSAQADAVSGKLSLKDNKTQAAGLMRGRQKEAIDSIGDYQTPNGSFKDAPALFARDSSGFQQFKYDPQMGLSKSGSRAEQEYWGGYSQPQIADSIVSQPQAIYNTVPYQGSSEEYAQSYEEGFKSTRFNPQSTFSIDVDTASYSNVRRFLNQGQLPPADAVRVEELINYFTYDYPQPVDGHPVSITTEIAATPWNLQTQLLMVGIQAKTLQAYEAPPSHLTFLIDVSGSMSDWNKLPLLKDAFRLLLNHLRIQDRISVVVYSNSASVLLESASGAQREFITNVIDNLYANGGTAGGAGIQMAYDLAKRNFISNGNNRVILATDGDFNVGISRDAELERLIQQKRKEGVFLTVLGVGQGNLKDSKMEKLADKGNGNYAYLDTVQEAEKILVRELGTTLFTVAKDVKIQMDFNPAQVQEYRLIGYDNRKMANHEFYNNSKDAGEMGAGHSVTVFYEVVPANTYAPLNQPGIFSGPVMRREPISKVAMVKLRYKEPSSNRANQITQEINTQYMLLGPVSNNFQIASAAAEFGLLLRNSQYKGTASYHNILYRVRKAIANDPEGQRSEFVGLVEKAQQLDYRAYPPPQPVYEPYYNAPEQPMMFKGQQ